MCEYCCEEKNLANNEEFCESEYLIKKENDKYIIEIVEKRSWQGGFYDEIEINYCPMCGEKLNPK